MGNRVYVAIVMSPKDAELKVGLYGEIECAKEEDEQGWHLLGLDRSTGIHSLPETCMAAPAISDGMMACYSSFKLTEVRVWCYCRIMIRLRCSCAVPWVNFLSERFLLCLTALILGFSGAGTSSGQDLVLRWALTGGGIEDDLGLGVAMDSSGSAYVVGAYHGPVHFGSIEFTNQGPTQGVLTKYDSDGNPLWARHVQGTSESRIRGVAVARDGTVVVAGSFQGTCLFESTSLVSLGRTDGFLAKYTPLGELLWVRQCGGVEDDEAHSVAVDPIGNVFCGGDFRRTASFGNQSLVAEGSSDLFLAKYLASGELQWVRRAGGTNVDTTLGMATDGIGNCYVTGSYYAEARFGGTILTNAGLTDGFLEKVDSNGTVQWVQRFGGAGLDEAGSVAVDRLGNPYMAGSLAGASAFGDVTLSAAGDADCVLVKYSPSGEVIWARIGGGIAQDLGHGVAVDTDGNVLMTGYFLLNASFGTIRLSNPSGSADVFVVKYDPSGIPIAATQSHGTTYKNGLAIAAGPHGSIVVTGYVRSQGSYGSVPLLNSSSGREMYLLRFEHPPRLSIASAGQESLRLSWPDWAHGFVLEKRNTLLQNAAWTQVPSLVSILEGQLNVIVFPTNGSTYYRLREQ